LIQDGGGDGKVRRLRLDAVSHDHLGSPDAAVGHHLEVQIGVPGPDGVGGHRLCFSAQSSLRHPEGAESRDPRVVPHGTLSGLVNFDPDPEVTEGLLLRGHADVDVRPTDLDGGEPAGQRELHGGPAADLREGMHTVQGVGVDQL